jgi:branched-subunit amino acid aminotransferase/4-amino-4-deoxychorismate lyase
MHELAYFNGNYLPAGDICLSVTDWGFVQGVTLAEQLRTFQGQVFCLQEHLQRLATGLTVVGWQELLAHHDLAAIVPHVAQQNHRQLDPLDDLGVSVFVTPGGYPGYGAPADEPPTVCVHTYRLPFHLWQRKYDEGLALVTVETRQVPADCWPAELKCRSRMHYYLAANEAGRKLPGATALLLDHQGRVVETPTANVVAYFQDSGLVSPPREKILPGISLGFLVRLAHDLDVPFEFREITPAELADANELMLTSTPYCLLPVARFNDRSLGRPGPLFRQLLHDWSRSVNVDIAAQAARFARRG